MSQAQGIQICRRGSLWEPPGKLCEANPQHFGHVGVGQEGRMLLRAVQRPEGGKSKEHQASRQLLD